jgi:hypothetical protein
MIEQLPAFINVVFILTTFLTMLLFLKAVNFQKTGISILLAILIFQGILSFNGFYQVPLRIPVLVMPSLLSIIILLSGKFSKKWLPAVSLPWLTALQVIRIPVEMVLFWLYKEKQIPVNMTFEGWNYDILSGITALPMVWLALNNRSTAKRILLVWNFICLGLLITIVTIAVLSAKLPIQQWGFDQPNVAIQHFPFAWLPSVIVPIVLMAHLISIRLLLRNKADQQMN